ncbi:hypothetical protein PILCRDRAFT_813623 [Piloderma croceum F 1598]|uniref:Uncharacterized protein n=1 Tax=Piloderma croceum (strain F 1598) TaxID=765440 RepID=A0A0C3GDD9_PILCF|nr:hypothetical protein PILCRDRAFT_813623 [Piloderma croceum F 1598]
MTISRYKGTNQRHGSKRPHGEKKKLSPNIALILSSNCLHKAGVIKYRKCEPDLLQVQVVALVIFLAELRFLDSDAIFHSSRETGGYIAISAV